MNAIKHFFFVTLGLCEVFHRQVRVAKVNHASFDPKTGVSSSCTSFSYACAICEPERLASLQSNRYTAGVDYSVAAVLSKQHDELIRAAKPPIRRKLSI